uniref:Uncharacterized protein n=1 Tax=Arundo donax TaxID=35708 RepID=A0A0A9HT57_ARUDO
MPRPASLSRSRSLSLSLRIFLPLNPASVAAWECGEMRF